MSTNWSGMFNTLDGDGVTWGFEFGWHHRISIFNADNGNIPST